MLTDIEKMKIIALAEGSCESGLEWTGIYLASFVFPETKAFCELRLKEYFDGEGPFITEDIIEGYKYDLEKVKDIVGDLSKIIKSSFVGQVKE
jgi:hypothetical protein